MAETIDPRANDFMDPEDQRVKDLQSLAWGLQSLSNKPGSRAPEDFKRDCYKLASRALSLCSDAAYLESQDWLERSKSFYKQMEAKKKEVDEVEEAEKQKVNGRCYRAGPGGNYTVGKIADKAALAAAAADSGLSLSSTAGGARSLTANEVVARLGDDPEFLSLCDMSLGDSDVEPLCQALQRAGSNLVSLDISHNLLADVGVQRLVSALAGGSCPKLKELHIGCNSFGDLGTQMLKGGLKALRKNLIVHLDSSGSQGAEVAVSADSEKSAAPGETAQELAASQPTSAGYSAERVPADDPSAAPATADIVAATAPSSFTTSADALAAQGSGGMQVELVRSGDNGLELRAVLSLPEDISASSDLDVDVSSRRIVIKRVSGALLADTQLPCAVISDTAQAVFSRKRRTMTLKLQPCDNAAAAALHGA